MAGSSAMVPRFMNRIRIGGGSCGDAYGEASSECGHTAGRRCSAWCGVAEKPAIGAFVLPLEARGLLSIVVECASAAVLRVSSAAAESESSR